MSDFRELSIWTDARRLTLGAVQFTTRRRHGIRGQAIAGEIRETCIMILSSIQRLDEPGAPGAGAHQDSGTTIRRLAALLTEGHREGVIGTFELVLMMRTASALSESLGAMEAGALCRSLPGVWAIWSTTTAL